MKSFLYALLMAYVLMSSYPTFAAGKFLPPDGESTLESALERYSRRKHTASDHLTYERVIGIFQSPSFNPPVKQDKFARARTEPQIPLHAKFNDWQSKEIFGRIEPLDRCTPEPSILELTAKGLHERYLTHLHLFHEDQQQIAHQISIVMFCMHNNYNIARFKREELLKFDSITVEASIEDFASVTLKQANEISSRLNALELLKMEALYINFIDECIKHSNKEQNVSLRIEDSKRNCIEPYRTEEIISDKRRLAALILSRPRVEDFPPRAPIPS